MSMMTVPSLAPGARTLPIGLRVPQGNAWGWHRLHGNMAPLTEHPIPVDPRISLSGLGLCIVDPTTGMLADATTGGACTDNTGYVDPSTISTDTIDYSQAPYAIWTQDPSSGAVTSQSLSPAQLTALINSSSASLSKILAITQGGSVLANGSIIGSQGAAQLAAQQSALNVSTAGLSGLFSNPIVLIGGLAVIALILTRK